MWKGARFISCLFCFLYIDCQSGVDIVDKNLIALKRSVAGFSPVCHLDIIIFFLRIHWFGDLLQKYLKIGIGV